MKTITIRSKSQLTKREYVRRFTLPYAEQVLVRVFEREDYHREEWSLVDHATKTMSKDEANREIREYLDAGWKKE